MSLGCPRCFGLVYDKAVLDLKYVNVYTFMPRSVAQIATFYLPWIDCQGILLGRVLARTCPGHQDVAHIALHELSAFRRQNILPPFDYLVNQLTYSDAKTYR